MVKKYLEITFCNSVIIGDIPTDYKDEIFESDIIKVSLDNHDNVIIKKIENYLNQKDKLIKMSQNLKKNLCKYNYENGYLRTRIRGY